MSIEKTMHPKTKVRKTNFIPFFQTTRLHPKQRLAGICQEEDSSWGTLDLGFHQAFIGRKKTSQLEGKHVSLGLRAFVQPGFPLVQKAQPLKSSTKELDGVKRLKILNQARLRGQILPARIIGKKRGVLIKRKGKKYRKGDGYIARVLGFRAYLPKSLAFLKFKTTPRKLPGFYKSKSLMPLYDFLPMQKKSKNTLVHASMLKLFPCRILNIKPYTPKGKKRRYGKRKKQNLGLKNYPQHTFRILLSGKHVIRPYLDTSARKEIPTKLKKKEWRR